MQAELSDVRVDSTGVAQHIAESVQKFSQVYSLFGIQVPVLYRLATASKNIF